MANVNGGLIAKKGTEVQQAQQKATVASMVNSLLSKEGYQKRFDELLGKRAPQFIGSMVSLVNADKNLSLAFQQAPNTVIQACLKAATYDLPIDPALGYAYIVPFNNTVEGQRRMEANFIMGYKGMIQLANRTGMYKNINATDVREGELISYDRLTGETVIEWVQDDEEREKLPIVGYVGFFELVTGAKKYLYMSKKAIEAHEQKNRKGKYMGKGWRENFDAMAIKTILRLLLGKWGVMSIDYRINPDKQVQNLVEAVAAGEGTSTDDNTIDISPTTKVDTETGEVIEQEAPEVVETVEAETPAETVEQQIL